MRTCFYCQSANLEHISERIGSDEVETNATLNYAKCRDCGRVDDRYTVIEFSERGDDGESGYSFELPANDSAWAWNDKRGMWNKIFPHYLTTKEVEERYGLQPGTARQAVYRGYVEAKKYGHTLMIESAVAERYWNKGRK